MRSAMATAIVVAATVLGGCHKGRQAMDGGSSNLIIPCKNGTYAVAASALSQYDFQGVVTEGEWNGMAVGDTVSWSMDMNDQNPEVGGDPDDQTAKTYWAMVNLSLMVSTTEFKSGIAEWKVQDGFQGTASDIPVQSDDKHSGDLQIILDGSGNTGTGIENMRDLDKKTFTRKEWFLSVIDGDSLLRGTITSIKKKPDQVAGGDPQQPNQPEQNTCS